MYSQVWKTMLYKLLSAWVSMFQVSSCFRSESWALPKAVTSHHWSKAFQLEFWGASKPAHGSLFNTDTNIRTLEKSSKNWKRCFLDYLLLKGVLIGIVKKGVSENRHMTSSWSSTSCGCRHEFDKFSSDGKCDHGRITQKKQHGNGKSSIFIRRYIFIHGWFSIVIRSFSGMYTNIGRKRGSWTWQFTWRCKKIHASGLSLECYKSWPKPGTWKTKVQLDVRCWHGSTAGQKKGPKTKDLE